jgi:hypothetical protein
MQSSAIHELRLDSRSNIFVMAALYAGGRPVTPVRVRNLSRMGALIEAAELPKAGTPVRLSRSTLSASGTVIWVNGGRGGLQFAAPVAVGEWLPQGKRGIGQQFVDELFHQKRLRTTGAEQAETAPEGDLGLAGELLELRLSLERAGEVLALDNAVAARHMLTIQAIDCVSQALARLAAGAAAREIAFPVAANG